MRLRTFFDGCDAPVPQVPEVVREKVETLMTKSSFVRLTTWSMIADVLVEHKMAYKLSTCIAATWLSTLRTRPSWA